jgi:hypothetical protein
MDHVVEQRDLAVAVGDDREIDARLLRVVDVVDPLAMRVDGVDGKRDDLHVALRELVLELGGESELGRAHRSEVGRCENSTPQLSPSHSWKSIVPSLDSCVKSGAVSPSRSAMVVAGKSVNTRW